MSISSFDPVPLHHSTVLEADLDSLLDSPFVLPENVPPPKRRCVARSTTQRKGTRHTVTSSAESATTCDSIFGSTQKPSSESDCDRSGIQSVTLKMPYNPDFIQSHNCNVLKVLNTGSVKDIQKLYTIGAKKAQLIHNFRQFHGSFNEINDLLQVPNFTEAAVKKFCVANFIQL
jgi:competence ComEA-like helix-hairpin-helix protein